VALMAEMGLYVSTAPVPGVSPLTQQMVVRHSVMWTLTCRSQRTTTHTRFRYSPRPPQLRRWARRGSQPRHNRLSLRSSRSLAQPLTCRH
jgi:hypothetical protein